MFSLKIEILIIELCNFVDMLRSMVVTFPEKELIVIIVFALLKNHLLNRTIMRYSAPLSGIYQGVSDRQCGTTPSEIAFPRHSGHLPRPRYT